MQFQENVFKIVLQDVQAKNEPVSSPTSPITHHTQTHDFLSSDSCRNNADTISPTANSQSSSVNKYSKPVKSPSNRHIESVSSSDCRKLRSSTVEAFCNSSSLESRSKLKYFDQNYTEDKSKATKLQHMLDFSGNMCATESAKKYASLNSFAEKSITSGSAQQTYHANYHTLKNLSNAKNSRLGDHNNTANHSPCHISELDACDWSKFHRSHLETSIKSNTIQRQSLPLMISCLQSPILRNGDTVRPSSAVSDVSAVNIDSPRRVVIGNIIASSNTSSPVSKVMVKPNSILKKDNSTDRNQILNRCVSTEIYFPQLASATTTIHCETHIDSAITQLTCNTAPVAEHKPITFTNNEPRVHSDDSKEWPSTPHPSTPHPSTPHPPTSATSTTYFGQMSFDSDTMKKLLRSLPSSPTRNNGGSVDYDDVDISTTAGISGRTKELCRTKSLNTHVRPPLSTSDVVQCHDHTVVGPTACRPREVQHVDMFNKVSHLKLHSYVI